MLEVLWIFEFLRFPPSESLELNYPVFESRPYDDDLLIFGEEFLLPLYGDEPLKGDRFVIAKAPPSPLYNNYDYLRSLLFNTLSTSSTNV